MKLLVAVFLFACAVVACGDSGAGDDPPSVVITRLGVENAVAILQYTVEGGTSPVSVAIDWGDGTVREAIVSSGDSSASHDYETDLSEVVITLVATDADGRETSASSVLDLGVTTTSATSTTSTTSTSSTSTTVAETTTTSAEATTTSPTATTTTLPQEAMEQVLNFRIDDPSYVEEVITPQGAAGTAAPDGATVVLRAETYGLDGDITVHSRLEWTIPSETWAMLGSEPQISVVMDYGYTVFLDTGPNPGRAAAFDFSIIGYMNANSVSLGEGSAEVKTIEAGETIDDGSSQGRTGFGMPLPPNAQGPITIALLSTCHVSSGSTIFQAGEASKCLAEVFGAIRVTLTRNDD